MIANNSALLNFEYKESAVSIIHETIDEQLFCAATIRGGAFKNVTFTVSYGQWDNTLDDYINHIKSFICYHLAQMALMKVSIDLNKNNTM